MLVRFKALGAVAGYYKGVTYVLLKLIDKFVGLRISDEHEVIGLDLSQHGEAEYDRGQVNWRGVLGLSSLLLSADKHVIYVNGIPEPEAQRAVKVYNRGVGCGNRACEFLMSHVKHLFAGRAP